MKSDKQIFKTVLLWSLTAIGGLLTVFGGLGVLVMYSTKDIFGIVFYFLVCAAGAFLLIRSRKELRNRKDAGAVPIEKTAEKAVEAEKELGERMNKPSEDYYLGILEKIGELNDNIANEALSEKIARIQKITSNIFEIIEKEPKKSDMIDTFISYYLPTTLKLLGKYAQYEKYGMSDNVDGLKREIESIIEKLVTGFEKQLDTLLINDVWDVTSDIDVLENMMTRDGLTESEFSDSRTSAAG